jgi:hypothetical protein
VKPLRIYVAVALDSPFVTDDATIPESFLDYLRYKHPYSISNSPVEANIILFFEKIGVKNRGTSKEFLRDKFILSNRNKLIVIDSSDYAHRLFPGLYASLNPTVFKSKKMISSVYYYRHNKTLYHHADNTPFSWNPKYLFSFRGNPRSHSLREKLILQFSEDSRWKVQGVIKERGRSSEQSVEEAYTNEILGSHFCLCPRGYGPSTFRIYEAMALGRCPVILSNQWVPPMLIDWNSCSLRIPEKNWRNLPSILEKESHRSRELGFAAKSIYEKHLKGNLIWEYHWNLIKHIASQIIQ